MDEQTNTLQATHIYFMEQWLFQKMRRASCDMHSAMIFESASVYNIVIIILCLILSHGCYAWLSVASISLSFNPNKI